MHREPFWVGRPLGRRRAGYYHRSKSISCLPKDRPTINLWPIKYQNNELLHLLLTTWS